MCMMLKSKKFKALTAKKPIKVYKVMNKNDAVRYFSRYQDYEYRLGELVEYRWTFYIDGPFSAYANHPTMKEGLHSCTTIAGAAKHMNAGYHVIIECEIPAGAKYVKGYFLSTPYFPSDVDKSHEEIVSDKLMAIREVTAKELHMSKLAVASNQKRKDVAAAAEIN